jgi:hypothetical protein
LLLLLAGRMGDPLPLLDEEEDKAGCHCALFLLIALAESNASSLVRRGDCRDSMFSGIPAPLFLPSDGFLRLAPKNRGMEDAALVDEPSPPPTPRPAPPGGRCWPWLSPTRRSRAADTFVIELFLILRSLCNVAKLCLLTKAGPLAHRHGRSAKVTRTRPAILGGRLARRVEFRFILLTPIRGGTFQRIPTVAGPACNKLPA